MPHTYEVFIKYLLNRLVPTALTTAMFTHICLRQFWDAGTQAPRFESDLTNDTARTSVLAVLWDNLSHRNAALQNRGHLLCGQWQLETMVR